MSFEHQNRGIPILTSQLQQIVEKVQSLENSRDKQEQDLSVLRHQHDQTQGIAYFADLAEQVKQCTEKVQQLDFAREMQEQKMAALQVELESMKSKKSNKAPSDTLHNVVVDTAKPFDEAIPAPKPPGVHWEGLSKRIEHLAAHSFHLRPLQDTVWEAPLILFSQPLTAVGSIITFFILVLNIFMQIVAVVIAQTHMTTQNYGDDTQARLKAWRSTVAHDFAYMNKFEMTSLASRVCNGDPTLIYAQSQADMVKDIETYLPKEGLKAIISGEALCMMALLAWWSKVGGELLSAIEFIQVICNLPKSQTRLVETETGFRFESLHAGRFVFSMAIAFIRIAICICLFFAGTLYIVRTTSLKDLLLKALALQVILGMDELIFARFAPLQGKTLMKVIAPLRKPRSLVTHGSTIRAMNIKGLGRILLYVVAMALVYIFIVDPHTDSMRKTLAILCEGEVDFVAHDDEYGLTYAAPSRGGEDTVIGSYYLKGKVHAAQRVKKAIDASIQGMSRSPAHPHQLVIWVKSIEGIERLKRHSSSEQYLVHQPFCKDLTSRVYINDLKHVFSNPIYRGEYTAFAGDKFDRCQDLVPLCWDLKVGGRVRWFCPEACGCNSPFTGFPDLYWGPPTQSLAGGCAESCHLPYQEQLANVSCTQKSPAELSVDVAWRTWSEIVWWTIWLPNGGALVNPRVPLLMLELGCGIVENESKTSGIDLCEDPDPEGSSKTLYAPGSMYRSFFRFMCPVTCRCNSHFQSFCPGSCSEGTEIQVPP